ncbi:MAG TPA: hypothetical protein VGS07_31875 [Thermoanaerobaculia bacterium]|jgi:hypothetical protein|nr:hypothetical protein [Thermoanaerobaculia bacterium]
MDDSEKTYGYSEDIYHGTRHGDAEKSYEYGAEAAVTGEGEDPELSPEEEAIHVEGRREGDVVSKAGSEEYDYGREGGSGSASVDSFTWDLSTDDVEKEPATKK